MSQLLIDVGHTRIKWAYVSRDSAWQMGVMPYTAATLNLQVLQPWAALPPVQHVRLANTCTKREYDVITQWCCKHWPEASITNITTKARFKALTNGYESPAQLGIDRWLGLIAAHQLWPNRSLLIIDCGTCMVADYLQADGQHQGGLIVPGYDVLKQTLGFRAGLKLPINQPPWPAADLGRDTQTAITQGTTQLFTGFLESFLNDFVARHPTDLIILTGGEARYFQRIMAKSAQKLVLAPYLVLQGLYFVAKQEENQQNIAISRLAQ